MTKKVPLFQLDQKLIDTIRRRIEIREELRNEIFRFESHIYQSRNQTYLNYIDRIANQVGVNLGDFQEDAKRRNKIQSRTIKRNYENFLRQTKELVQEEAERQKERKRYLEYCGKQIQQRQDDPELEFFSPPEIEGSHWTRAYRDPESPMFGGSGCHEPSLSRRDYSDGIEIGGVAPEYRDRHRFLPRIYIATGEDDREVSLTLLQCIILNITEPLERGRGNFLVNEVRLNISGVGYSQARIDDTGCPILLEGSGLRTDTTQIHLQIRLHQATSTGLMDWPVFNHYLYGGNRTHSEAAVIEPEIRIENPSFEPSQ